MSGPLRSRSRAVKPARSRRGPVLIFALLLLIAVTAQFSASLLDLDPDTLMRSGISIFAVLMAVYVAALIAVAVVIERRHRTR